MSNEILFDNLVITDDINVAREFAANSFDIKRRYIDRESVSWRLMPSHPKHIQTEIKQTNKLTMWTALHTEENTVASSDAAHELQARLVGVVFPLLADSGQLLCLLFISTCQRGWKCHPYEGLFVRFCGLLAHLHTHIRSTLIAIYLHNAHTPYCYLLHFIS